jgi:hypothetical protein
MDYGNAQNRHMGRGGREEMKTGMTNKEEMCGCDWCNFAMGAFSLLV